MGLVLTITILFGVGLFGLWPACYVADKALKSKKICFYCGPLVILYLLALIISFVLYIVYVGFSQVTPSQWAYVAIEIPLYLLFSIFVISGFREFLKKPESKKETKEETPVIDVLDAEKPKEEKKEEPKMEEIKFDSKDSKKELPPYVFEFSTCAEDDQFIIRLKFTNNIPINEEPALYYRRMTEIILATILKDSVLNIYRVKIEDRKDYNPNIPLFPPFYKFRLYNAGIDKFDGIKGKLIENYFVKNHYFNIVSRTEEDLAYFKLLNNYHAYPNVSYGKNAYDIDGFFFKDNSSTNNIGLDLRRPIAIIIMWLDFCFSFAFKCHDEEVMQQGNRYLYVFFRFENKDFLMADVSALLLLNISLDELKKSYKLNLNYPKKEIRQVTHPYSLHDFTEIPVCIPFATSSKERKVVQKEHQIHNGACNFIEKTLGDKHQLVLMHIYPFHIFNNGYWYLYYNVYVPCIDNELAKQIQQELEIYEGYELFSYFEPKFLNTLRENLSRTALDFFGTLKELPFSYFMLSPTKDSMVGVTLTPKKNKAQRKKTMFIENEIEMKSDFFQIKLKTDYDDNSCNCCFSRIKVKGNPYAAMNEIDFLRNENFNAFVSEYEEVTYIDFLFYFKGEEDQFMTFVEALDIIGTQIDKALIFPAKAKTIRPLERVKYFQKLLDNHDYANTNEKLIIQNCLDLAKRRNEERKKSPNRLFIRDDFK